MKEYSNALNNLAEYMKGLQEENQKLKDENKELKKSIQEFRESIDIWKAGGYSNHDLEKVTDNIGTFDSDS